MIYVIYVMNLGGTETTRENISSECDMMKNIHVTLLVNLVTEFLVRQRGLAGNAEEETARTVFRSHLVYPQAPSGRYCHGMQRVS